MSKASFIKDKFREFRGDTCGAVAIIYALTLIMVFMIAGLAIDTARGMRAGHSISTAVDAAVIAGVKGLRLQNMTDTQVINVVTEMFNNNIATSGINAPTINAFNVTINRGNSSVQLDVDAEIPTVLGGLAGVNKLSLPRRGVAIYESQDIEIALQLDVTGSMGGQKIADLKLATKDLIDILIPNDTSLLAGQKIRIGFAPYAAGVNAGSYASLMNGGAPAPDACVYKRSSQTYQDSDTYQSSGAVLQTRLDLPGANNCPNATVLPMTDDKLLLKSTVDSYTTGGTTAGHLGTAFAWYLLSPEWASIWPASSEPSAYGDGNTTTVAILMTGGEYNTVGGSMSGGNVTKSAKAARDTCKEMKAQGIIVYTVGFKLNAATAQATLEQCASDGNKFYEAKDGDSLRSAFQAIAQDIATLRLSE
jgi:Flp pilus assembly protein TadG